MIAVPDILQLQFFAIDHHILHTTPIIIDPEVLLSIHHPIQPKRDIDNPLIRVPLHQAQNQPIRDILDILKLANPMLYQFIPLQIFNQQSK